MTATIQDQLRTHLDMTGESMRALSLRAGLGAKAVADILHRPGLRSHRSTVLALADAMGVVPAPVDACARRITYAELIRQIQAAGAAGTAQEKAKAETEISRLRWLLRKANWVAETRTVNRREVVTFFEANRPATFDLTPGSYASYKTVILKLIGRAPRPRSIKDLGGLYAEVHALLTEREDYPLDLRNRAGSFLVYLDAHGTLPGAITTETLRDYHAYRLEVATKDEETVRKNVKAITTLLGRLHADPAFASFGFTAPDHPYHDGRDKYGVADSEIASLLAEFDARVTPWSRGELSATGQTRAEFIAMLDARAASVVPDKKARLRKLAPGKAATAAARDRQKEDLTGAGFLLPDDQWSPSTLKVRRGYIVAAAKALLRHGEFLIESLEELTDPDVVAAIADVLASANEGEFPSDYVKSVLLTLYKIAEGLVCRDAGEVAAIAGLIKAYSVKREGLAPRNVAKLQLFTEAKVEKFFNLSSTMLADIDREVSARKRRLKRKGNPTPSTEEIYDADLAQEVMLVVAQDIMLARAPRSANVLEAELGWIRWRDEQATIVVPAHRVKGREEGDADLPIRLSKAASATLRIFVDRIRPVILTPNDQANPYLFPSQDCLQREPNRPYANLLRRLCKKVHAVVGVPVNPHLYRHLVGWVWLRDDPSALPMVSKLLGHRSIQTTINYYAEIDDEFANTHWGEYLDDKTTQPRRGAGRVARAPRGTRS